MMHNCFTSIILVLVWSVTASVFFLFLITVDRFLAVVFPLRRKLSVRGVVGVACATWICAAAVAMPNLFVYELFIIYWSNREEIWCEPAWKRYIDVHTHKYIS